MHSNDARQDRGMAAYGVDYLRRLQMAVEEFETAFERWMETQVERDHLDARGLLPTVHVRAGVDARTLRDLELRVAESAGAAASAVPVTGTYFEVAGYGHLDPVANWSMMRNPKALLSAHEVRTAAATARGRLASMIVDAEAGQVSDLPAFSPAALHPVIWAAVAIHWTSHQYRVAVRESSEALTLHWKERLNRHDVDDTVFWQQSLSPGDAEPGRPKLTWPGDAATKTAKSMRGGLEPLASSLNRLATGLNLTVRNVTTHTRNELTEQEAMERLSAYSYLARMLDLCDVQRDVADGQ